MKHKKLLSLFLTLIMLLSMLPAAAFGSGEVEPDLAITAFDLISLDAGVAGAAAYEDAAAVIDYLNENYASVTARTYGGGTAAVPVAAWADKDTYDPAVAGSYIFTAVLGEIPAGYANPGTLTATAEIAVEEASSLPEEGEGAENEKNEGIEERIENQGAGAPVPLGINGMTVTSSVYEITGFAAIAELDGGTIDAPAYADAAAVIAALPAGVTAQVYGGGTLDVPVTGWTDTDTYKADVAGSYTFTAALEIPAGYTLGAGVTDTVEAEVVITDPDAAAVNIPDANLKMAVCAALKKPSDYNPTVGDMKSLTELDASNWGIKDLTGLWTAVNLEKLDLSGNPLTANVTSSTTYNNVFVGIEALTKLKTLDLSGCDLGINPVAPANISRPASMYSTGVNLLESLEVLDLSGNHLKGSFGFSTYATKLATLKEIDLSDNEYNAVTLAKTYFPNLERIDISRNYIYFDESETFYATVVEMGVEKYVHEDMKNLADLYSVKVTNAGVTTAYYAEEGGYEIDAGTVLGDSLTFACQVFSSANTVKVTVDGEKYTAGSLSTAGTSIPLSGFELGTEHTVSFEVMHLSEVVRTYSLKFTTTALPSGSAGITDASLQAAVCAKLGKDPATYAVTQADMASLTSTDFSFTVNNLTNAEGIQYATSLTKLSLSGTFSNVPDLSGLTSLADLTLSGTYSSLPDLSGLTKLTRLTLSSLNLTEVPDLPASLKELTIYNADSLASLPDVTGITALQTIEVRGGSNLSLPAGLSSCTQFGRLSVTSSPGFDFTGLENTSVTSLSINTMEGFTLPSVPGLTSLGITSCGLSQLPEAVADMTNLTNLNLGYNAFTDIPEVVADLPLLKGLTMSFNPISVISPDLSGMTQLESLYLSNCNLTAFPESLLDMETSALKTLNLTYNKIRNISGSMANLTSLTNLSLDYNSLLDFPVGILDLPALQYLSIGFNRYTDLPAGFAAALGDTLAKMGGVSYGGKIKFGASSTIPAEDTQAYQERSALQSMGITATLTQNTVSTLFSELRHLDTSAGELTQIHDTPLPTAVQNYTLYLDSGTSSITFTPTAIYGDTAITVNGAAVANGSSVAISLTEGLNSVSIVCYNAYRPSFATASFSNTTTYNLAVIVGSAVGEDFPAEGRTYSIDFRLWKQAEESYSMADAYFFHAARFTYDAELQQFVVDVTTNKYSWIPWMKYMDASGHYVDAECSASDTVADTAVYRLYVADLDADLYITPMSVPMGYAPVCRIIFDTTSIVDITNGEPQPGDLADGQYTIDADALKEYADEYSMTNQFLTEPAKLTVAGGQITLTMVWHGTSLIPMTMVEGLWYQDSSGEFVEITRNIDAGANTLTFSMPLAGITEPTMMKVYAPAGMGETYPLFRLVFNEETLTPVTGEERAVYTLTPIEDEVYQAGTTSEGIHTMTVNPGFSGLKYFGVQVTPVTAHSGEEAVVFTHQRDGAQLSLNVTRADFDSVSKAQAGFNVLAGDVIKVYIVDDLTNDPDCNPIILQ